MARRSSFLVLLAAAAFGCGEGNSAPPRTLREGVYTEDQAVRGRQAFAASCSKCHKDTLQGNELIASLKGDEFVDRWQGRTVLDLLTKMRATMPPDGSLELTDAGWLDMIAFLLASNHYPAGSTALSPGPDLATLKIIRPEARKSGP